MIARRGSGRFIMLLISIFAITNKITRAIYKIVEFPSKFLVKFSRKQLGKHQSTLVNIEDLPYLGKY